MRHGALFRNEVRILHRVWRAETWSQRLRGLLFRPRLEEDDGLLITPCASVHTVGMRYPLDLIFIGRDGHVLACAADVRPWRARFAWGAHETLELSAGALSRTGVVPGDRLRWEVAGRTAQ